MLYYNIWRYNPANDDIEIIMPNIEGIDKARDLAAARSVKTQIQHEYALVGGEYDQILREKLTAILAKQEEEERFIQEEEATARLLIADRPTVKIYKVEANNGTDYVYEMIDEAPDATGMCIPSVTIENLVWNVSVWVEQHPLEEENKA